MKHVDSNFSMFSVKFLKEVMTKEEIKERLPFHPLRFLILDVFIVGGLGSYVVGEVLCGTLKPEYDVITAPKSLESEIGVIEKDSQLCEEALPGEFVALTLPEIRCKDLKRGMVLSEKSN